MPIGMTPNNRTAMTHDQGEDTTEGHVAGCVVPSPAAKPASKIEPPQKARQGRPRDKTVHQTILKVTRDLARSKLTYKEISFEAVAKEARVAKSTLYRWWGNKAELLREACFLDQLKCPDTGDLIHDLEDLVRQEIVAQTTATSRPVFAALLAELISLDEASESEVPYPYQEERQAMIRQIFEQATARGNWRGGFDVVASYETLFAMIFYHSIGCNKPFTPGEVSRLAHRMRDEARVDKL